MRKKLLAIIMLISLLIGVVSPQAGAEAILAPGAVDLSGNLVVPPADDQQLPLPQQRTSVTAATYGEITIGSIDGYQLSRGEAMIIDKGDPYAIGHTYLYLSNGKLPLRPESILPASQYSIYLKASFVGSLLNDEIVYLDKLELTGEQLLNMRNWPIAADSVEVTPDVSTPGDLTNKSMNVQFEDPQTNLIGVVYNPSIQPNVKILMKPGTLRYSFFGKKNDTGYVIQKSADVQGPARLAVAASDLSAAVELTLPSGSENVRVYSNSNPPAFDGINKLVLSKSNYKIYLSTRQSASRIMEWNASMDVSAPKRLNLSDAIELEFNNLYATDKQLSSSVMAKSGDFYLGNVYDLVNGVLQPQMTSKFIIKNEAGTKVHEFAGTGHEWAHVFANLNPVLKSGKYSLEVSATYPGRTTPLATSRDFIIRYMDEPNTNGLVIRAQDETGQPLQNGQVFLYEKQLPQLYEANNGVTDYYTVQKYDANATEPGKLFIPSAQLLPGTEYEVVVTGSSSNGQGGGVYYHQSVTSGQTSLDFAGSNLKKITYAAGPAQVGDYLNVAIKEVGKQYLTWPIAVPFNNQHQAVVYVQTNDNVFAYGYLYPSNTAAGYYLENERSMVAAGNQSADLTADLVEITPPGGYDNPAIKVHWSSARASWFVPRGTNVSLDYSVSKDGYRYAFEKVLKANQNTQLSFQKNLTSKSDDFHVWAGHVNQSIYSNFYDEQDNMLYEVERDVQNLNERRLSEQPAFQVHGPEGTVSMSVQNTGQGIVYREISANGAAFTPGTGAGGGAGAQTPLLEYQLYDTRNQPVGNRWLTDIGSRNNWNAPNVPGDYVMKLVKQNFPENVAKLSSDINIHVSPDRITNVLKIPLEIPSGYALSELTSSAEMRTRTGADIEVQHISIDSSGNLSIYSKSEIVPDKEYVILMAVVLKKIGTNSDRTMYYNQLRLKGSELLNLARISVPSDLVKVRPAFTNVPRDVTQALAQYMMPVGGYGKDFNIFSAYPSYEGLKLVAGELLTSPGEFMVNVTGTNSSTTGYNYIKKWLSILQGA
ncbi:hypothetical protein [Cohnella cholangitidis]|uniref:Uncharacterized protein n=1 Tax=Cohnella cholangitidis TaxID=2598458 RepID=A0A7G5BXX7_9BACL|nr:hypothetical protein [Cohnella cholangitidis]QMV41811.1 hypothetical protein FPL14_11920 [Cohnella cholangitidis]